MYDLHLAGDILYFELHSMQYGFRIKPANSVLLKFVKDVIKGILNGKQDFIIDLVQDGYSEDVFSLQISISEESHVILLSGELLY